MCSFAITPTAAAADSARLSSSISIRSRLELAAPLSANLQEASPSGSESYSNLFPSQLGVEPTWWRCWFS
uniref:Uncharacterized protein n=1 Tax=Rhizophora mucronata TaxID=61149 RepID=A0A2P2P478_RHIMU